MSWYGAAPCDSQVGPLQPEHAVQEAAVVGKERVKPPCSTRALLVALRLMVVFCALFPPSFYPYELALSYFIFGEENAKIEYGVDVAKPLMLVAGYAYFTPYFILAFLTTRDTVRHEPELPFLSFTVLLMSLSQVRAERWPVILGLVLLVSAYNAWSFVKILNATSLLVVAFFYYGQPIIFYIGWVLASYASIRTGRIDHKPSRVGMLYSRCMPFCGSEPRASRTERMFCYSYIPGPPSWDRPWHPRQALCVEMRGGTDVHGRPTSEKQDLGLRSDLAPRLSVLWRRCHVWSAPALPGRPADKLPLSANPAADAKRQEAA